jgi:hypothetical protein
MRWLIAIGELALMCWFVAIGIEAMVQRAALMRSPFKMGELHHAYVGVGLVILGFVVHGVTGILVQLLGVVLTVDDVYQHQVQTLNGYTGYRSPLHQLFAATLWTVPGIPALVRFLDRWWSAGVVLGLLVVWLLGCASARVEKVFPAKPPVTVQPVRVIWWSRPMLEQLGAIADTATREHYRCLLGVWRHDTLYVVMAYEPQIIAATALFVATSACPSLLTVAEFHNHIPRNFTMMGEDLGRLWPLAAYCKLSLLDRRVRADSPLLQVIAVNRDVSCAWVLDEGQYVRMAAWPPVLPP